jgi:hypothetical protein
LNSFTEEFYLSIPKEPEKQKAEAEASKENP